MYVCMSEGMARQGKSVRVHTHTHTLTHLWVFLPAVVHDSVECIIALVRLLEAEPALQLFEHLIVAKQRIRLHTGKG